MERQYETIFIVSPIVADKQLKNTKQKYEDMIREDCVELVHQEEWGLQQLSYPIQKKESGYYYLYEYRAEPELVEKLKEEFDRDQHILRYLTVELDRYAIEHNEERRRKQKKKKSTRKKKSRT